MAQVLEKVALRKKNLTINYTLPEIADELCYATEELRLFVSYYNLDTETLLPVTETNLINRLELYAPATETPSAAVEIPAVIEDAKEPETGTEQWVKNIQHANEFLVTKRNLKITLNMLQETHKILLANLPGETDSGKLRAGGRNLFSFIEEGVLLPEGEELQNYLTALFEIINSPQHHVFARAFSFYYVFTTIKPFRSHNETLAILVTQQILIQGKMFLHGLLNLEKHIFFNNNYQVQTAHLLGEQNYLERLDADLSAYLEICLNKFKKNINEARETIINIVKNEFEYDVLSPRQKNAVNFWLQKGFFMHKDKLKTLTPRQHDIMALLARYSFIATKDLVPVFQLDRKTIQRDFNTLLEMGLVEQRGGAAH